MSQYPPSGPRNTLDDFDDDDDMAHHGPSSGDTSRSSGGGNFTYYPEERYWTDYLRIAAPVLGVIILLALAWFWLSHLIGGGNGTAVDITPSSASNPALAASPTATTSTGTPVIVATATAASSNGTPAAGGEIANGAKVVVANTNGDGVNMRDSASTTGNVVAMLPEGTALTVTGDSVKAEQYTWWPVKDADGQSGYIASDFLKVAP